MNIFAVDTCPIEAARALGDRHVVKMVLETAQMLSTVWHVSMEPPPCLLYRPTHRAHPCVVWTRENAANYLWLQHHGAALCAEYTHRYGRTHKSESIISALFRAPSSLPEADGCSPFAQAMPEEFRQEDAIAAYRSYYRVAKAHLHAWTNRAMPHWLTN